MKRAHRWSFNSFAGVSALIFLFGVLWSARNRWKCDVFISDRIDKNGLYFGTITIGCYRDGVQLSKLMVRARNIMKLGKWALLAAMICAGMALHHNAAAVAATTQPWADITPAPPVIPDKTFNLIDFGAVGDGKTFNTDAFDSRCCRRNGGRRPFNCAGGDISD
jgi:hypothetical protein